MLYGSGYFTEDEWVKVDGAVHKGQYVMTRGPNILEEELMSFEEPKGIKDTNNLQTKEVQSIELNHKNTEVAEVLAEDAISSTASSEPVPLDKNSRETPNTTSTENSDEEISPTSSFESAEMFDFSEKPVPKEEVKTEPTPKVETKQSTMTNGGLPAGYTQEQLDEVRAFNATLKKKGRPLDHGPVRDSYIPPTWGEEPPRQPAKDDDYSDGPSHTEIQFWASEVNAQNEDTAVSSTPTIEIPTQQLGFPPKRLNDIYQPNNPQHWSSRSESITSRKTVKSLAKPVLIPQYAGPKQNPGITPGRVLKAQSGQLRHGIQIEIREGDHITVVKHVSGIMHIGFNLRTKEQGQFSEDIFRSTPGGVPYKSVSKKAKRHPSTYNLDKVEYDNAAEWDDITATKTRSPLAAPAPLRPAGGKGLAASRFSSLADIESTKQHSEPEISLAMKKEFGKMVDQKVREFEA
jgi:hypothetical protein